MPGLGPGIHVFLSSCSKQDVDGRDKPGHDVERVESAGYSRSARKRSSRGATKPVWLPGSSIGSLSQ